MGAAAAVIGAVAGEEGEGQEVVAGAGAHEHGLGHRAESFDG